MNEVKFKVQTVNLHSLLKMLTLHNKLYKKENPSPRNYTTEEVTPQEKEVNIINRIG